MRGASHEPASVAVLLLFSESTRRFFASFLYFLSIVAMSQRVVLPHFGRAIGVLRKSKLSRFFHSIRKSYFLSPTAKFPIG
jgi:hypothetical protein